MTNPSHDAFFRYVAEYVEKHPTVAPHVGKAVEHGLSSALMKTNQRAADMEVALMFALVGKRAGSQHRWFIAEKLRKWAGQTALNWDKQLAKLERELT